MHACTDLVDALATAPRVRLVVLDPNGGEDITGEIVFASETMLVFRGEDGLKFTLPAAHLRVLRTVPVTEAGERRA